MRPVNNRSPTTCSSSVFDIIRSMGFEVVNPQALARIAAARERMIKRNHARRNYERYPTYRETQIASAKRRYERFATIIREAKDQPCVDCGICLPAPCMDLDHVRGPKLFSPSQHGKAPKIPGKTHEEVVREEIAKCEVRCANCHRLRHYYASLS